MRRERILKHFKKITSLPHCSGNAKALRSYLVDFATAKGYGVEVDMAGNILIQKGSPSLVLQAHYDMVCVGRAPEIETYEKEGWLYAKESSLGADNGMAIAMMMLWMEQEAPLGFLLTSDEEIGLVGASAISLKIDANYMLNLDYEDEGIVCIGCAGGADLIAEQSFEPAEPLKYAYELEVSGLLGGHSGVEIHKDIPNAIKIMAEYLRDKVVRLAWAQGGERRNSIPTRMVVRLSSDEVLLSNHWVKVTPLNEAVKVYETKSLIGLLNAFKHGVHAYNEALNIPQVSINLAKIALEDGQVLIESSSRSMSDEELEQINTSTKALFSEYGFSTKVEYKYPAWRPEETPFTQLVKESMEEVFNMSRYEAIHAGLECGILQERYPHIAFVSIGPTIVSPHSTRERVDLDSVDRTFEVVERIISKLT